MRVLIQRSISSSVKVDNKTVGKIDHGFTLFVAFTNGDTEKEIDYLINKIIHLRVFDDENKVMNKNILEVNGSILSISQFTLYADSKKGNRPSYVNALNSKDASILYDLFNQKLRQYIEVETGIFQADMQVNIINDGPITIMLER